MLKIEDRHYGIIRSILAKYPYTFYAFGSRVSGNPGRFSDLDLCFVENIPFNTLAKLEAEFEESDLPYKVDIVDYNSCSQEFRKIISHQLICIQIGALKVTIDNTTAT